MNRRDRTLAALVTGAVTTGTAVYGSAGVYIHEKLIEFHSSPFYQALEAKAAEYTGWTSPDRLSDIGTILAAIALVPVCERLAIPVCGAFASLYRGEKLETLC